MGIMWGILLAIAIAMIAIVGLYLYSSYQGTNTHNSGEMYPSNGLPTGAGINQSASRHTANKTGVIGQ